MIVIVSNKQKSLLDSANIDAIKVLNGLFNVDDLINSFKGYFFSKIIIDATSIIEFAKEDVLRRLVNGIGAEKIILLLPETPEPPKRFCDFLVSLGVYNYSTKLDDILKFLQNPNTSINYGNGDYSNNNIYDDNSSVSETINSNELNNPVDTSVKDKNYDNKLVLGFRNVTLHAGSTTLVYLLKEKLQKDYKINVDVFEIDGNDFKHFNSASNMFSINSDTLEMSIHNSKSNIILIDLPSDNYESYCDDVIYLIEPSIIKINKLLSDRNNVFTELNNKKVVLNKSVLSIDEVSIFGKEAGINIYFNIPYLNDRIDNSVLNDFINKLGLTNKGGQVFLGLFK